MSGLVAAEVPLRVRMAPELWLGLTSYELTVPDFGTVPICQFLSIRQTADAPQESEGVEGVQKSEDTVVFAPEALHGYQDGPKPV
ncbi:hypothetical protein PV646_41145 [Streptomyces sp. ID05-26A]|nr:hypothetical protein [Streptomyces sp. ID05-26A]